MAFSRRRSTHLTNALCCSRPQRVIGPPSHPCSGPSPIARRVSYKIARVSRLIPKLTISPSVRHRRGRRNNMKKWPSYDKKNRKALAPDIEIPPQTSPSHPCIAGTSDNPLTSGWGGGNRGRYIHIRLPTCDTWARLCVWVCGINRKKRRRRVSFG